MADIRIKKVIQNIYSVNYKNCKLDDGEELIIEDGISEFVSLFKLYDLNKGIIVSPAGYERGFVYKSIGEVINVPEWVPEIIKFNLGIYGLKTNGLYKLTVIARNAGTNNIVTKNRQLTVTNSENELLIDEDLSGQMANKEYHTIFKANGNETTLFFTVGKLAIRNIIIDEVELVTDSKNENKQSEAEEVAPDIIENGSFNVAAYSIFTTTVSQVSDKQTYLPLFRYAGKGLNLYLDKRDSSYILERDNREDVLGDSFVNAPYLVDINLTKLVNNGYFVSFATSEVSNSASPNTLKQGYLRFKLLNKDGETVPYKNVDGQIFITIRKIF